GILLGTGSVGPHSVRRSRETVRQNGGNRGSCGLIRAGPHTPVGVARERRKVVAEAVDAGSAKLTCELLRIEAEAWGAAARSLKPRSFVYFFDWSVAGELPRFVSFPRHR